MILKNITIENFRGIELLSLKPNNNVTVLCGINGAGKTSILDAISLQLSWFIARLRSVKGNGKPIKELDIKNGASFAKIVCSYQLADISFDCILVKTKKGRSSSVKTDLAGITTYKNFISSDTGFNFLPLFVHYNVGRSVMDIPLKIRTKHTFDITSIYDGALDSKIAFRSFFEWFRDREDYENEQVKEAFIRDNQKIAYSSSATNQNNTFKTSDKFLPDSQLAAVRYAIEKLTDFKNITVKRRPLHMQVEKNNEVLWVDQLSEGEKCLFALVGDLARRLAIANPHLKNCLDGDGLVLIDEIEEHLHPKWQKEIIGKLNDTFPNVQFIVTTHSPQVLTEVDSNSVFTISVENEKVVCCPVSRTKGLSSNEILEEIMDTQPLNKQVKLKIDTIFKLIDDEKILEAKVAIAEFKKNYGTVPEIVRGETLLSFYDE